MNVNLKGHPKFHDILEELRLLHSNKNSDYATKEEPLSNLRACEKLGLPPWVGVMVRLQDKWDRLTVLSRKRLEGEFPAVKDESMIDTLKDNAIYSILAIILLTEGDND